MTRPNCMRCGHPVATPDDWRDIPEGGEEDLCWGTRGDPCVERLPVLKTCADCKYPETARRAGKDAVICDHPDAGVWQPVDPRQAPPSWCPLRGEL